MQINNPNQWINDLYNGILDKKIFRKEFYETIEKHLNSLTSEGVEDKLKHHKIKCPQCGMKLKHYYY